MPRPSVIPRSRLRRLSFAGIGFATAMFTATRDFGVLKVRSARPGRRMFGMLVVAVTALSVLSAPVSSAQSTHRSTQLIAASPASFTSTVPMLAPGGTAGFGIQPANSTAGDGRPNFIYGGGPGAVIHDHVALVNIGPTPLKLDLYPADATTGNNGQFTLRLAGEKETGIGAWITLHAPKQVTLPPRTPRAPSVQIVSFDLRIPLDASPGDHVGAVLVSLHTAANASGSTSLGLNQRVGVRVYLRVAGPVHPALTVEGLTARYKAHDLFNPIGSGDVKVSYRVKNSGNVILSGTQDVSVSGLFGSSSATDLPPIPRLLPGDSFSVSSVVKNVFPQIRLSVKVTLHPTGQPGEVDPGITDSSRSKGIWAVPWALIVLLVLLLGGGGWYLRDRRMRSRGPRRHGLGPPPRSARPVPVGTR